MKHFVLEDISPEKAMDFEAFLSEMNDISALVSAADAPYISADQLRPGSNEDEQLLKLSEGYFEASFRGEIIEGEVKNGRFELREDGKKIMEASYSVGDDKPISLRVKLNCEGESLVKSELERAFERDFSHEAYQFMKTDLPPKKEDVAVTKEVEEEKPATSTTQEIEELNDFEMKEESGDEITEELKNLSDKVMNSIDEVSQIINKLNNLCYDLTRGKTVRFSEENLDEELLENGATVQMIDEDENGYKITFRKGILNDMSEVSFFLEKEGELIFSVYISSSGEGHISANRETVVKRVKRELL